MWLTNLEISRLQFPTIPQTAPRSSPPSTRGDKVDELDKISRWITQGSFIQAYYAILTGLEASPGHPGFLDLSKGLSAAVRSRCIDLASSKATEMSQTLFELEALLYLVIRLNGEGVYP
jgi:hypothetical protein